MCFFLFCLSGGIKSERGAKTTAQYGERACEKKMKGGGGVGRAVGEGGDGERKI